MDTNSQVYKLTFWSSIKPFLWPLLATLFFVLGFMPILAFTANSDSFKFALIIAIVWVFFTGIPPVVLEINYLLHDRKTSLKIDKSNGIVEISNRDNISRFLIDDIILIEKHHSGIEKGERFGRMHWHTFYYYKLLVRDSAPIFISRMIVVNLEKSFENTKCEMSWERFPIIKGEAHK